MMSLQVTLKYRVRRVTFMPFNKKRVSIFLISLFILFTCVCLWNIYSFPGAITLQEGEEDVYNNPFLTTINTKNNSIVRVNKICSSRTHRSTTYNYTDTIAFKTIGKGIATINLKILGIIPVRTLTINVIPEKKIVTCGNTIGVRVNTSGVLIIGISDVKSEDGKRISPAKICDIRPGDLILQLGSQKISCIKDLIQQIDGCSGMIIPIKYKRGNIVNSVNITPIKSVIDHRYKIGLWVRDNAAGIGTLTFYDAASGKFGALGHGISDSDTGMLMPIESGEVIEASILAVKKGIKGNPGELRGLFMDDDIRLGTVKKNAHIGIYGILNKEGMSKWPGKMYPIAHRGDIKEASATILANIDGKNVEEYSIQIQKVSKYPFNAFKGMLIKITDPYLLNATGGIVQGMSGSP